MTLTQADALVNQLSRAEALVIVAKKAILFKLYNYITIERLQRKRGSNKSVRET